MHNRLAVLVAVLLSTVSAGATRAEKAPAAGPGSSAAPSVSPPPELKQFEWFEGTWKCAGKMTTTPTEKEQAAESTLTIRKDLDGSWQAFTVEEAATAENPHPVRSVGYGGYDRTLKKFIRVGFNNRNAWSTWTSDGWEGDKVVFLGAPSGKKVLLRQMITRKGANQFGSVVEVSLPDGTWKKTSDIECRK